MHLFLPKTNSTRTILQIIEEKYLFIDSCDKVKLRVWWTEEAVIIIIIIIIIIIKHYLTSK